MKEVQIEGNFDDEEHDDRYFNLIYHLLIDHRNRYDLQTSKLLDEKTIIVEIKESKLRFSLTLLGCSYLILKNDATIKSSGWVRMGWGRASKREALPRFFARAEANATMYRDLE
jgi:hypothetical protein